MEGPESSLSVTYIMPLVKLWKERRISCRLGGPSHQCQEDTVYDQPSGGILTWHGNVIKEVEDYKYLGAWISSTKKDF